VLLRAAEPGAAVGALQADLPALRPGELDEALQDAATLFATGAQRVFCPDAQGSGTTLLLAASGVALEPLFGAGSAARHRTSGAVPLNGARAGLRQDVDTGDDLCAAAELGLGPHTRAVLAPTGRC
jgi:2-phospho-L-lactate guanylyltransferase